MNGTSYGLVSARSSGTSPLSWMSGNRAFMVEERSHKTCGRMDGSGYLQVTLSLGIDVDLTERESALLQQATIQQSESGIWGSTQGFNQPKHFLF